MSFCVTKNLNIHQNALKYLSPKNSLVDHTKYRDTEGGVLSNLNYAWLVNGSRFIVISCKNGSRVGSWDFGNTLQDINSEIVGVDEIQRPHGREPLLMISMNSVTTGGIICIFDFIGSKVLRAISFVEQISSVHVIDGGLDLFNLSGPLRNFDGIFAVGTIGGNVYIVDLYRQFCYEGFGTLQARDDLHPCPIQIVTSQDLRDIENHKKNSLRNESHLAIHLNMVHDSTTEHFVLKGPNGVDKLHVNKEEVQISALHYCPQLGSILVGYNFGAYQLWNLMTMELIYTSPICDDHIPITSFAIQEPADDPRAFCYIWAVYSSEDSQSSLLPYLVMYAFCYESKEFHEGYGLLFENFQYCSVRFHMELGFGNNISYPPKGGKCLRMNAIKQKNSALNGEVCMNENNEDLLSICVIVWRAMSDHGIFTYMALFDLNQWYKAQMPNSPTSYDCSSYMIRICVTDLMETIEHRTNIIDVAVNGKTLQQFIGAQKLEEHYHPSALSFDAHCLLGNKYMSIQYQGIQKALLYQLQMAGPLCLIRPTETYQDIIALGLTPLFVEIPSSPVTSLNFQREVILNVALEQQLTSWLCKCVTEWANGSFSSAGCSLELLTTWALQRATVLKKHCDILCEPLFDYSETKLDTNATNILNNCIRQIKNISFFYSFIVKNHSSLSNNAEFLSEQCDILQMIDIYFDVLQWLFNVGLLPEYSSSSVDSVNQEDKIRAPYPADELAEYYRKRRSELQLAMRRQFSTKTTVLFIDNLIELECGGDQLGRDWKNDGGDGFYPPRSLQALLRTYLMNGIEVNNKHSVVIYLFLDLAMILDPNKYSSVITHLIKFPAVFKVCPSLIKITQAFWQLDHGDFSTAMEQLLDPLVNSDDLKYWHHKIALKSLLVQDQHNSALLYLNVRKPPILDDEDVLCALSLFVSNNMLDEAFYLEQKYENYVPAKKFIKHLFAECSKRGCLNNIVYRNLTQEEEELFLQYLDEVQHPEAADLKITYFVQRSHYMEAFKVYEQCNEDPVKKGLISQSQLKVRDQIVHSYKKLLPTVSYKFIQSCSKEPHPTVWKKVSRPEPMSVTVQKVDERAEYKSSLILAALVKAKQTFNGGLPNLPSMMNSTTEELPFLRTPTVGSRKRSSIQNVVPKMLNVEEEDGPSPPKRKRWSNKFNSTELSQASPSMCSSILITPIVQRKDKNRSSTTQRSLQDITGTPTSILKNTSLVSGRKSITQPSNVRFDVPSSSSPEEKSLSLKSIREREARTPPSNDSVSFVNSTRSTAPSLTPKTASDSDDVFYSPNSSLNNIEEIPEDTTNVRVETPESHEDSSVKLSPRKPLVTSKARVVKLVDYDPSSSSREESFSRTPEKASPKGRKSYKKLPGKESPARSSPRLTRNSSSSSKYSKLTPRRERGGGDKSIINEITTPVMKPSEVKSRISRKVVETSEKFEKVETSRKSIFHSRDQEVSVEENDARSKVSTKTFEYSDVYSKNSAKSGELIEEHSVKTNISSVKETIGSDSDLSCDNSSDGHLNQSSSSLEELIENQEEAEKATEGASAGSSDISLEEPMITDEKQLSTDEYPESKNSSSSLRISTPTRNDQYNSSNVHSKQSSSPRFSSKIKSRKPLSRQVLENNAFTKLTSEYQRFSSSRNTPTTREVKKIQCTEKSSPDSSQRSESADLKKNRLSLSDSLQESNDFGGLRSESDLMGKQSKSDEIEPSETSSDEVKAFEDVKDTSAEKIIETNESIEGAKCDNDDEEKPSESQDNFETGTSATSLDEKQFLTEYHPITDKQPKSNSSSSSLENNQSNFPGGYSKQPPSPRYMSKITSRKSLSRQVLEHNAFSKLTPVHQRLSPNENVATTAEVKEIQCTEMYFVESTKEIDSPSSKRCRLSLSDSLLEDIAFGRLRSEKALLDKQSKALRASEEDEGPSETCSNDVLEDIENREAGDSGNEDFVGVDKNIEDVKYDDDNKENPIENKEVLEEGTLKVVNQSTNSGEPKITHMGSTSTNIENDDFYKSSQDSTSTASESTQPTTSSFSTKITSLQRHVLERNAFSKLTPEIPQPQCDAEEGQSSVAHPFDISEDTRRNRLSLSDSLLESIAFGRLESERILIQKQAEARQSTEEKPPESESSTNPDAVVTQIRCFPEQGENPEGESTSKAVISEDVAMETEGPLNEAEDHSEKQTEEEKPTFEAMNEAILEESIEVTMTEGMNDAILDITEDNKNHDKDQSSIEELNNSIEQEYDEETGTGCMNEAFIVESDECKTREELNQAIIEVSDVSFNDLQDEVNEQEVCGEVLVENADNEDTSSEEIVLRISDSEDDPPSVLNIEDSDVSETVQCNKPEGERREDEIAEEEQKGQGEEEIKGNVTDDNKSGSLGTKLEQTEKKPDQENQDSVVVTIPARRLTRRSSKLLEENRHSEALGSEDQVKDEVNKGKDEDILTQPGSDGMGVDSCEQESEQNYTIMVTTPARRLTRRSSKLLEENTAKSDDTAAANLENTDEKPNKKGYQASTPIRRSRSRLSMDPSSPSKVNLTVILPEIAGSHHRSPKTYSRKRTRSIDIPMSNTYKVKTDTASSSKSSDFRATRRSVRSSSVEYVSQFDDRRSDNASKISDAAEVDKGDFDTYAFSRRLTRRQAKITASVLKRGNEVSEEPIIDLVSMESQDLITLLDKPEFEGEPDPQEANIYDTSPTSSVVSASVSEKAVRARRTSRSSSVDSEVSSIVSNKSTGSRRQKSSPVSRATRSCSKEKLAINEDSASEVSSVMTTRSKKVSAKSDISGVSSRSRKRKIANPCHLPKIKEENNDVAVEPKVTRNTAKTKTKSSEKR